MKNFIPHFLFDKQLRNGVFILTLIIFILQLGYFYYDFSVIDSKNKNEKLKKQLENKLDSLKILNKSKITKKLFNPNYISDFKGYQLGMSVNEIDRLHQFRKDNKFVNSKEEFQKVTGISDSLLGALSPYFKFPTWVTKKKINSIQKREIQFLKGKEESILTNSVKDINQVSELELIQSLGIKQKLANRIIKYRKKLGGYTYNSQLKEVWGIDNDEVEIILKSFKILNKPSIKKLNINTATFNEVLKLPYIDYDLCKKIFDYREEVAEIQHIEELKNIIDFPIKKYDRIILYLLAD